MINYIGWIKSDVHNWGMLIFFYYYNKFKDYVAFTTSYTLQLGYQFIFKGI